MTKPWALYNEIDPFAAAWLEQLIASGHIAPGVVDRRSIDDLRADDLRGFRQVHFFAGIGVWSYALRRAGVPDDAEIWTGSCPCQPFSAAGKGGGMDDERHLWPSFYHLIRECRPRRVCGEQVASKDGLAWLDLVQTDLEGAGYANGAVDLCAAGVGAPHIRQRLWWFAELLADTKSSGSGAGLRSGGSAEHGRLQLADDGAVRLLAYNHAPGATRYGQHGGTGSTEAGVRDGSADSSELGWMADCDGYEPRTGRDGGSAEGQGLRFEPGRRSAAGRLADNLGAERPYGEPGERVDYDTNGRLEGSATPARLRNDLHPGPTNGLWRDADWLFCRDGKWRPVEPGTFPLAHGAPARVGRLRGYGNAIVAQAAQAVIEAYLEARAVDLRLTSMSEMTTDNNEQTDIFS